MLDLINEEILKKKIFIFKFHFKIKKTKSDIENRSPGPSSALNSASNDTVLMNFIGRMWRLGLVNQKVGRQPSHARNG